MYDGDSFELLDSLALKDGEVGLSLLQVQLGGGDNDAMQEDDNRTPNNNNSNNNNNNNNVDDNNELEQCVVVGTAHPQPQDDVDPSAGRLLLLSVGGLSHHQYRARRLVLRAEAQTAGAVFSLASLGGTGVIAAGVNSSVTVWRWRATTEAGGDNSGTLRLTATKVAVLCSCVDYCCLMLLLVVVVVVLFQIAGWAYGGGAFTRTRQRGDCRRFVALGHCLATGTRSWWTRCATGCRSRPTAKLCHRSRSQFSNIIF